MVHFNSMLLFFMLLYVGQTAFRTWVDAINLRHSIGISGMVPRGFEGFVDKDRLERMNAYTVERGRIGIFEEILSDSVLLVILLSGLLPLLANWFSRVGITEIPAALLFFFIIGAIQFFIELPFGYHQTFVIEEKFGFNRSTLKLWALDLVKSGLISMALFAALLTILLLLIRDFPQHWWFWGFLTVAAVQVLLAILFPVVIAPLFNKFEPVRDEDLASKIMRLMSENGIRVRKILQMDAGLRSRHTNAYFTGIGKTKQIVLYDTLLESHTHDEILSVLAHEAGHFRKKHVPKQLLLFGAFTLGAFYVTYLFINWPLLYSTFGFSPSLPYAGLFLAGIILQKAGFFLQPLYMWLSRRFEVEADSFAVNMLGTAEPLLAALKRLSADNLSNLNPHPLYVRFHYSHPPIILRAARLEEVERNMPARRSPSPERLGSDI